MLSANRVGGSALKRSKHQHCGSILLQQVLHKAAAEAADTVVEHQVVRQWITHATKLTTPMALTSFSVPVACGGLFDLACSVGPCLDHEIRRVPLWVVLEECDPHRESAQLKPDRVYRAGLELREPEERWL